MDLGDDAIIDAVRRPTRSPPLRELAAGKQVPCSVIDDLSRPTLGDRILPIPLDELAAAGISEQDATVLMGVAKHRTLMRADIVKKIGERAVQNCRIRNHFSWRGCTRIGTTSRETPIEVNDEFLAADLRILVGSIVPHPVTGFSGGAKMVMPAVSSIASATAFHTGVPNAGQMLDDVRMHAHDRRAVQFIGGVSIHSNSMGFGDLMDAPMILERILSAIHTDPAGGLQ